MVPSIARQSVILKCNLRKSVMVGNYEFYYALGLMKKLFQLEVTGDLLPEQMMEQVQKEKEHFQPKDEKEEFLIRMVTGYEYLEEYNEQMKYLFEWGSQEEFLWQIHTSQKI